MSSAGSFFCLNLTLAVIWDEFNKANEEAEEALVLAEKYREEYALAEQGLTVHSDDFVRDEAHEMYIQRHAGVPDSKEDDEFNASVGGSAFQRSLQSSKAAAERAAAEGAGAEGGGDKGGTRSG